MADKTTIEWTDATWNPVHGCSKVSPGCAHCYAESLSIRFGHTTRPWTPANAEQNVQLKPDRLSQPLRWKRPRMVFVNSMSDLFHELVPWRYVADVFAVMARAQQHTFQVLTKRPERMRAMLSSGEFWEAVEARVGAPLGAWVDGALPNVWLGTSIENRRFVDRAEVLAETPAAVRFISAEPLLGPLIPEQMCAWSDPDGAGGQSVAWKDDYTGPGLRFYGDDGRLAFHWLIVGGESGVGHRPIDPEWVRDLRDVCVHEGVAFFFKQWGGRFPKQGGRDLDGRTWDELPSLNPAELVRGEAVGG